MSEPDKEVYETESARGAKVLADLQNFRRHVDIVLFFGGDDGLMERVAAPVTFKFSRPENPNGAGLDPTMKLDHGTAQALLDALLASGIKPRTQPEEAKQILAMQAHLKDMRHLVFKGDPPK